MNIKEILHKRVLVTGSSKFGGVAEVTEYKILELAPSKNWIKIQDMYGRKFWKRKEDLQIIEILDFIDTDNPNKSE